MLGRPLPSSPPPPPTSAQGASAVPPKAAALWVGAAAVMFDVDSTLSRVEGIDELAAFLGCGEEVSALTTAAMGEGLPFEQALAQRLALMAPSRSDVDAFLAEHPPAGEATPGAAALLAALAARGTAIFLVSGGFDVMIYPLADALGVPREHIFANRLLFHREEGGAEGAFAGFDTTALTCRSGGKLAVARQLKRKFAAHGALVAVGDGVTDLEARGEGGADCFIGFGGVRRRPAVEKGADAFVLSFDVLRALLHTVVE